MVNQMEIVEALQAKLHNMWPDTPIIEDLVKHDFTRPSLYLDVQPPEIEDAACALLHIQQSIGVVAFPPIDGESLNSTLRDLVEWQQSILQVFACGYLRVGNRALHLNATGQPFDSDAATVVLELDYYDGRPEETQEYEKMGDLQVAIYKEE